MPGNQTQFDQWDPLSTDIPLSAEIYGATLKRQIKNIIKSYTGWFDPLSELIQNALDAVDMRRQNEKGYSPKMWVEINLNENYVCVTDNGIGFKEEEFRTFLRPNVSFKGGGTRGDKGVGTTYLAYGFNFLQIGTKTKSYSWVGNLEGGREWVEDEKNIIVRPVVQKAEPLHEIFKEVDQGATFCLKFVGTFIRPSSLAWFGATTPDQWETILRIKTPLGGIYLDREIPRTTCSLCVIDQEGQKQEKEIRSCSYLFPHEVIPTCVNLKDMIDTQQELAQRGKSISKLPDRFYQLNGIYSYWNYRDITSGKGMLRPRLEEEEKELLEKHKPSIYGFFTYSTDIWDEFNDEIVKLRRGGRILKGGLQLAVNSMPQGQLITIPLTANIGYQQTSHVVAHFNLAEPDLGRKGFQPELQALAEKIAVSIVGLFTSWRMHLKTPTGSPRQILQDKEIHDWMRETEDHEQNNPILIRRKDVFLPTNEISLTATPLLEQDVIVLFNQLLAGGVIRGIKLMSASQYKQYDGLWKAYMKEPLVHYLYDKSSNPLGVQTLKGAGIYTSAPYVLEYKYNFDALLEEIEKGDKDESAIKLVVCWDMGDK